MRPTKNDFLLTVRKATFTLDPDSIPLGGMIGEERFHRLKDAVLEKKLLDSTMTETNIRGTLTGSLGASVCVTEFRDFPVVKYVCTLENAGGEDLSASHLCLFRHEFCGDEPKLLDGDGNTLPLPEPPHPHRPKEGEKLPPVEIPPMLEGKTYFLVYEDFTVMIESDLPKRFHSEPAGASAILALHGETLPAGTKKEYPEITMLVCEGGLARAKEMYADFRAVHFPETEE